MKSHVRAALDEQTLRTIHGRGPLQLVGYVVGAVTGRRAIPDRLPHPRDAVTLELRGCSQLDTLSCGVTAGFSVVSSFHPGASFDRFYRRCRVDPKVGVTMANLKRALEASGVEVDYRRRLTFGRVVEWINEGRPIICNVQHEPDEDGVVGRHWLVIYGYREPKDGAREVFVSGYGWGAVAGGLFSLAGQHRIAWQEFARMFGTSGDHQGHAFVCSASDGRTIKRA